jgi:hypothetical protein
MVQRVQNIADFLVQHTGQYYCDKCISDLTGVKPPNQVNQITRGLSFHGTPYRRVEVRCSDCGKVRMGTARVTAQN